MKINIDKDKIESALIETAEETFRELGNHAQSYIIEEKREYPRTTYREYGRGVTGKIAGSPRDVVDTGNLRDSYDVSVDNSNGLEVSISWSAPYVGDIYFGDSRSAPYPFVTLAIESFNLENTFKEHFSKHDT